MISGLPPVPLEQKTRHIAPWPWRPTFGPSWPSPRYQPFGPWHFAPPGVGSSRLRPTSHVLRYPQAQVPCAKWLVWLVYLLLIEDNDGNDPFVGCFIFKSIKYGDAPWLC